MKSPALIFIVGLLISASILFLKEKSAANKSGDEPVTKTQLPSDKGKDMGAAAKAFLQSLEDGQKKKALYPFKATERKEWSYFPGSRAGIPLGDLTDVQKKKAMVLLRTGLSENGFRKANDIIRLEDILREIEGRGPDDPYRDKEAYYFSIFGEPDEKSPWGWRLEGHHLSLNYSSVDDQLAVTPAFMGANPATVPSGKKKGWRVLGEEEDMGRSLIRAMSEEQLKNAVISKQAFPEILTGNDQKVRIEKREGIAFKELNEVQQSKLKGLILLYLNNMEPEIAETQWGKIKEKGLADIHFAWAGSIAQEKKHYYRIHGPSFLVEYDNSQNNGNHIHTVWRDLDNDFGEDLLKKHYDKHH